LDWIRFDQTASHPLLGGKLFGSLWSDALSQLTVH